MCEKGLKMNINTNYSLNSNICMKGGTQSVLTELRKGKFITLDTFEKKVAPLMDDSGKKLDLNKLSTEDLDLILYIKKHMENTFAKSIETMKGLKKFFSRYHIDSPILYKETEGTYNGAKVLIGIPVGEGDKYIKTLAQTETEAVKELGLKSIPVELPQLKPYTEHYKEVFDKEGHVIKRDEFIWDDTNKVMKWCEVTYKPSECQPSYDTMKKISL